MPLPLLLLSFSISAAVLYVLVRSGMGSRLAMDNPNVRSLHAFPVPRIGGIVMVPAFLVTWLPEGNQSTTLALLVAMLAALS